MKILRHTYLLILALLLVGCSSDGADSREQQDDKTDDKLCEVRLHISAASQQSTFTRAISDANANENEMMNLWTVVAVNTSTKKVAFIHACKPAAGSDEREIDDLVKLEAGEYDFYSFANIPPTVVCHLMGITMTDKGSEVTREGDPTTTGGNDGGGNGGGEEGGNDNDPTGGNGGGDDLPNYCEIAGNDPIMNINSEDVGKVFNINFTETTFDDADITAIANKEVGMNGNGFNISEKNAFFGDGIPMSNKQTVSVTGSADVDLIVVRMFAKMELQLFNETSADIIVKSATLSDINGNFNNNIKLLPSVSFGSDMEAHHGDIHANVGTTTYTGNYTYTPASPVTVPANYGYDANKSNPAHKLEFYVNESGTPKNAEGLFYLTLEVDNGSGGSEYRYALISNTPENEWNYIARNDYRIIPIRLDDMKFEIVPYDFPPIGVYPVSVKELDATNHLYEFTFHDYGHFHLLPTVTKGGTPVAFSATMPTSGTDYKWTFIYQEWNQSWFTAATMGGAADANPGGFYRTGTGSTTADGDDEGQAPVWYANDGVAGPQWDPAASANYRPFVFGYIADPGSALSEDKKVYHEMKIQVYNGTTAYRQMLYRFYMTLSSDQMLYAPSLVAPAPRRPHWQ